MEPINVLDYEALAREKLPGPLYDWIAGGAADEVTLGENVAAFRRIQLRPRVLIHVARVDTSTEVLGQRISLPVLLAPVGLQRIAHSEGELASARAATAAGTISVLSTISSWSVEAVAEAASGPRWFQLYVRLDQDGTKRLIERAQAAGYSALCVTVDGARYSARERDIRNRLEFPPDVIAANLTGETEVSEGAPHRSLTWDDVDWLRSITSMPLVLKGIMTADDARLAVEHGVAAIIVSNHGGRQLDGAAPTIAVLPEIVEAVDGRIEVLLDGGVRRGADVLKALALGAKAILIGRPYIWGLAVAGEAGVTRILELLKQELETAMALCGCSDVQSIPRSLVR